MATHAAPVKVDEDTHALIAHAATALHMTHKELLAAAVREYLASHREQIRESLRRTMAILDDTDASHVSALTGLSRERLDELGGVPDSE